MFEVTLSSDQFKEIVKNAILELMRDHREELSDFFAEILEDIAMEKAIDEGKETD